MLTDRDNKTLVDETNVKNNYISMKNSTALSHKHTSSTEILRIEVLNCKLKNESF